MLSEQPREPLTQLKPVTAPAGPPGVSRLGSGFLVDCRRARGGDCLSRLSELIPRIKSRATGAGKPDQPCPVEPLSRLPHPPSPASCLLLLLQQTSSHFAEALPIVPGFMTIVAYLAPALIVV